MAYRDTAANIYNLAAAELKEADALGKEALIAVETKSSNEGSLSPSTRRASPLWKSSCSRSTPWRAHIPPSPVLRSMNTEAGERCTNPADKRVSPLPVNCR